MQTLSALIDIAPFLHGDEADRRAGAATFGHAFETTGFVTLVGHGIDGDGRRIRDGGDGDGGFRVYGGSGWSVALGSGRRRGHNPCQG